MHNLVKYISASQFYFWEKCPLKALYYNKYKTVAFFPIHPDADLGSIIHKFYEKRFEWNINSDESFEKKWVELINKKNNDYLKNDVQRNYYPIQWYSKYYAVKKILLKKQLITMANTKIEHNKIFEEWVNDEVVGGYIDLQIKNKKGKVVKIIDFKTGKIFEKVGGKNQLKESHKMQLALYAHVIKKKQGFYPKLQLQDISGAPIKVELSKDDINQYYERAKTLKTKLINFTSEKDLATLNEENCKFCSYRPVCEKYKESGFNKLLDNNIDLKGKIIKLIGNVLEIEINKKKWTIKNLNNIGNIQTGRFIYIYNLYCNNENFINKSAFALTNTIIRDE